MSAPELDIYDDDYWRGFEAILARRRYGMFAAMNRLDQLSRELIRQADEDHERRMAAEIPEDRARREERQRTLRDLVVRANATADPGEADRLWASIDAMMRPGAE